VAKAMETVSAQDASKLSIRRRKCESPLLRASHQSFAAGKSRIESTLERFGRFGALDHDRVIVLALVAGCGKVRGDRAEQPAVDQPLARLGIWCAWRSDGFP
jgi:hypothetical protein